LVGERRETPLAVFEKKGPPSGRKGGHVFNDGRKKGNGVQKGRCPVGRNGLNRIRQEKKARPRFL